MDKIELFQKHLEKYLPKEDIKLLLNSFSNNPYKGIFINNKKVDQNTIVKEYPFLENHPFSNNAFIYQNYEMGKTDLYELGAYYIQEPSSVLSPTLLQIHDNELILDMCAAPGGKAIEASLLNKNGVVIANDISKSRCNIIIENIERMGIDNIIVTCQDFTNKLITNKYQNKFDRIILDAPCSGSGMFRKDERMFEDWSYEKVLKCAEIQKQLIINAYMMLKPGGLLMYSTCSYSFEEDEEVVQYLINECKEADLINLNISKMFYSSNALNNNTIHLFPYLFKGEGLYLALIRKPGLEKATNFEKNQICKNLNGDIINNLKTRDNIYINDALYSLNKHINTDGLFVLRYGVKVYEMNHKTLIPHQHYARFLDSSNSFPLNGNEYHKYIAGNELLLTDIKDGWNIVSYNHLNCGFVKAKNGRAKNHYPKGLRK